jgi:DNA polymerase III subunit epsilon
MPASGVSGRPAPPPRPGRTPWREARYAALDFETTGLDYRADTVVSFGVVPVEHGRAIMRGAVHQLVRPDVPPTPLSQTVHELRPQDLADAPPLDAARATLADAIAERYLLVWFADVEVHFLRSIFGGGLRSWRRRTIDVRTLAIAVDGGGPEERERRGYPLGATAERWGIPVANAHEAFDDALVTALLFLALAPRLASGDGPSLRRILKAARG